MEKKTSKLQKIKNYLLYCGIEKKEYFQVKDPVGQANHKALDYWSVLVSIFWIYCIVMSFFAVDYRRCRPAYIISLSACIISFICSRFVVTRFPKTLMLFKFFFRFSLIGGGIAIALFHPDVRSLTMFAVAIISPSIFIDSTVSSLLVHFTAFVLYYILGINFMPAEIFYWGLGNFVLFSVFGFFIGNAINKERIERYVYGEYEKKFAEAQMRYANYDSMTGLKNRHAFEEMMTQLENDLPSELCIIMADINGLKQTNDTLGHKAGDELIIGTSQCLKAAFEGVDTIYRIGGDEFCIITTDTVENAKICFSRLEELISQWHGQYIDSLSVSTGAASVKNHDDLDSTIIEADQKMYENKRQYYEKIGEKSHH